MIAELRCKKMAEYKHISTHIYYWPIRRSKTIHLKAFRSSINGTLLSVVSVFWSHYGARIQIDLCCVHVRTFTRDVT